MMPANTKYFLTFAADSYPVEPRNEISENELRNLTTYYRARYDADDRLREFEKLLLQRGPDNMKTWTTAFIEQYDYWPSGRLMKRTLVGPDRSIHTWQYEDLRPRLSPFLSRWFEKWCSKASSATDTLTFAERLGACHELVNDIESGLFLNVGAVRNIDWAFQEIAESLPMFKACYDFLVPSSHPRVSFLLSDGTSLKRFLSGFDELFGVAAIAENLDVLRTRSEPTPLEILSATRLDSDAEDWLKTNGVAAAYALPIRMFRTHRLVPSEESHPNPDEVASNETLNALNLADLVLWLRVRVHAFNLSYPCAEIVLFRALRNPNQSVCA